MDLLIKKAADRGILIMLDMHRIHGADNTIPALWYSDDAPEKDIISVWKSMATRYKDYYNMVVIDVKNEPHDSIEVGTKSEKDWWAYCGRAGNELLKINPKLIILCEGYDKYVNPQKQRWDYNGWGSSV